MSVNLYHGDCLELMATIPDKSIDLILCDLPYGTTEATWDSIIPWGGCGSNINASARRPLL